MNPKKSKWPLVAVLLIATTSLMGCETPQTAVPEGSATPTNSPEPTPSPAPTATVEATAVATLSPQESELYVEELLENNGGCSLPCVWGITPDKTKYEEAKQFFQSLGWRGSEAHGYYETGKDMQGFPISLRIAVYPNGDVVERISFGVFGNGFRDKVEYYTLAKVLETLGKPSQVLAFVGVSPGVLEPEQTSFEILLHYAERNTLLEYTGTAIRDGDAYRICPSQPNAGSTEVDPLSGDVSIYGAAAGEASSPEELVRPFWILPDYYLSVEQAFGISVDEFYDTVSQGNGNACFESPLAAWER